MDSAAATTDIRSLLFIHGKRTWQDLELSHVSRMTLESAVRLAEQRPAVTLNKSIPFQTLLLRLIVLVATDRTTSVAEDATAEALSSTLPAAWPADSPKEAAAPSRRVICSSGPSLLARTQSKRTVRADPLDHFSHLHIQLKPDGPFFCRLEEPGFAKAFPFALAAGIGTADSECSSAFSCEG